MWNSICILHWESHFVIFFFAQCVDTNWQVTVNTSGGSVSFSAEGKQHLLFNLPGFKNHEEPVRSMNSVFAAQTPDATQVINELFFLAMPVV